MHVIINIETSIPYIAPFITGTPEGIPMVVNNNNELFVVFSMQSEGSPSNITTGYKGMTIDTNGYYQLYSFNVLNSQMLAINN